MAVLIIGLRRIAAAADGNTASKRIAQRDRARA